MQVHQFPILLPGGGVFRFTGPFPMSREQWQHIRTVMDAMAPGLITHLPSDPSGYERFRDSHQGGHSTYSEYLLTPRPPP
jgi:hypothetical protein